ncbi:MAG: hypothetical protein A2Z05_07295 [Chloroflexi bacterium RBG_16_60_22]|nr:MAG: hypothetical protein A2Z05_07295 [Chloroflexi bacterium RBG_16_60_22]
MKIAGKTVCVTGAAGFLGAPLCRELIARGARVIGLDNFSVGHAAKFEDIKDGLEVYTADVRDPDSLKEPISRSQVVFHLAAIDNRKICEQDPTLAFNVNIMGTSNVLSLCSGAERVVYLSSTMVYGEPKYLPIDEKHPLDGYDPYAVSKIAAEHLFRAYHFIRGIPFTIVRNTNTFGPGQGRSYLIPSLIIEGLTRGQIDVWTPGVLRDFQYVDNCIDALIRIAESAAAAGETVNLGSGLGITVGELTDIICRQLGASWVDVKKPAPVSSRLVSDISRLRALTGWEPKISLEEGLRRTIAHYRALVETDTK